MRKQKAFRNVPFGAWNKLVELTLEKIRALPNNSATQEYLSGPALVFTEMMSAAARGAYPNLSMATAIEIVSGLAYLVDAYDEVPDDLPGGFQDDLLVIQGLLHRHRLAVDHFLAWREGKSGGVPDFLRPNRARATNRRSFREIAFGDWTGLVEAVLRQIQDVDFSGARSPELSRLTRKFTEALREAHAGRYHGLSMDAAVQMVMALDYFLLHYDEVPDSQCRGFEDDLRMLRAVDQWHRAELTAFERWFKQISPLPWQRQVSLPVSRLCA